MARILTGLICVGLTFSLQTIVWAADSAEGQKFARRVCSTCHLVTSKGQSPMADAPPFALIARSQKFRVSGAGLLFQSHTIMPNFAFTNEQAENVAAYIKTLVRR
jgi:mono/diheme cytochrome c family protein